MREPTIEPAEINIHRPLADTKDNGDPEQITLYAINGTTTTNENDDIFAKLVKTNKGNKYFVKASDNYTLFNLVNNEAVRKHNNLPKWKLIKVKETVFNYYLRYLQSRNEAYLINARREMD